MYKGQGSGRERAEAFDLPGVGHAIVVAIAGHLRHRGEGGPTAYVGGIVNETAATTGGILFPAKGARKGRGGGPASIGWSAPGLDEQVKECTPGRPQKEPEIGSEKFFAYLPFPLFLEPMQ